MGDKDPWQAAWLCAFDKGWTQRLDDEWAANAERDLFVRDGDGALCLD